MAYFCDYAFITFIVLYFFAVYIFTSVNWSRSMCESLYTHIILLCIGLGAVCKYHSATILCWMEFVCYIDEIVKIFLVFFLFMLPSSCFPIFWCVRNWLTGLCILSICEWWLRIFFYSLYTVNCLLNLLAKVSNREEETWASWPIVGNNG